jgi:hypothetical protein
LTGRRGKEKRKKGGRQRRREGGESNRLTPYRGTTTRGSTEAIVDANNFYFDEQNQKALLSFPSGNRN